MTAARRWSLVALGVALLVAVPLAWRAVPPPDSDVRAADLLALVRDAEGRPWSGYVETRGTLQLPVSDEFSDVGALLGEETRIRAWWRGPDDWRVDRLLTTGETDLLHDGDRTTEWSFEAVEASISTDPGIRLPRTADLVPPVLVERVLRDLDATAASGATERVARLPARRVAGVVAPGLRVVPAAPQSSIDHVDLWADPATGVALRVEVHADAGGPADFTSAFREFSRARPDAAITDFTPTATTEVEVDDVLDIADAANQYAPLRPPRTVGGLPRAEASDGAVGVYGTGLTQLVAIPLRDREAGALRAQLGLTPGATLVEQPAATTVGVGPLGVLLTGEDGDGGWLVAGTVTRPTLVRAARDLLEGTVYVGDLR